ncbi:unnamed protein product [Somion occarium]|uniref:Uncharacterized protein n=1 Tax=Somion occarium TaxID=3059160 RepID=A0ABP1DT39_9APHY
MIRATTSAQVNTPMRTLGSNRVYAIMYRRSEGPGPHRDFAAVIAELDDDIVVLKEAKQRNE